MTRKAKQGSEEDYSKIKFTGPDVISGRKRLQYLAQVFGQVINYATLGRWVLQEESYIRMARY